jgi:RNA polymerase sigma factor (sigma-70 family)
LGFPDGDGASGDDVFYDAYLAPLEARMLRVAWRITRDPDRARDALQDAMARIWKNRERVRSHPNPAALLLRITIQAAMDVRRREDRWWRAVGPATPRAAGAGGEVDPSTTAERREARDLVLDAIARLPAKQAAAVTMRVMEDAPYEAIAAALGCAEPTARVHVLRGREKLKHLLHALAPVTRATGGEP